MLRFNVWESRLARSRLVSTQPLLSLLLSDKPVSTFAFKCNMYTALRLGVMYLRMRHVKKIQTTFLTRARWGIAMRVESNAPVAAVSSLVTIMRLL